MPGLLVDKIFINAVISKNFVNLQASGILCATIYLALAGV